MPPPPPPPTRTVRTGAPAAVCWPQAARPQQTLGRRPPGHQAHGRARSRQHRQDQPPCPSTPGRSAKPIRAGACRACRRPAAAQPSRPQVAAQPGSRQRPPRSRLPAASTLTPIVRPTVRRSDRHLAGGQQGRRCQCSTHAHAHATDMLRAQARGWRQRRRRSGSTRRTVAGPPTRAPPRHHSRSPGSPPPPELTSTCAGGAGPGRPWPPDDLEPVEAVGDSVGSDMAGPRHQGWMDEEKGRVWRGEACEVAGRAVGGGSRTRPGRVPAPSGSRRQGVSHSSSTAARPLITRHTGQPPPSPSWSNLRPIWAWLVVWRQVVELGRGGRKVGVGCEWRLWAGPAAPLPGLACPLLLPPAISLLPTPTPSTMAP